MNQNDSEEAEIRAQVQPLPPPLSPQHQGIGNGGVGNVAAAVIIGGAPPLPNPFTHP